MSAQMEIGRRTEPVIGDRALFAVQTLEIGRLSGHVVPIVPAAFIPVSGEGDRADSNGSGKTTFLAAVALLLGDPQWRLGNASGAELMNLLFDPVAAGATMHAVAPATHGYVIGAFERDGDVRTAWLRINRARRKMDGPLQARVFAGLQLAHGDGDQRRLAQADELWTEAEPLAEAGLRNYARTLYGEGVRAAAYVRTRGARWSGPSLLAAEVDQFETAEIGAELLRLCGQDDLLRHDEQQRRDRAETRKELREAEQTDRTEAAAEALQLADLDAFDRARAAVQRAEERWDEHFAVRCRDLKAAIETAAAELTTAEDELGRARHEHSTKQNAVQQLPDDRELRGRAGEIESEREELADAITAAASGMGRCQHEFDEFTRQRRAARLGARGWSGIPVEEIEPRLREAEQRAAAAAFTSRARRARAREGRSTATARPRRRAHPPGPGDRRAVRGRHCRAGPG